jgi:hypothetical protein
MIKGIFLEQNTLEALPPNHRHPLKRVDLNFISKNVAYMKQKNKSARRRRLFPTAKVLSFNQPNELCP